MLFTEIMIGVPGLSAVEDKRAAARNFEICTYSISPYLI
jgi:hypothetical protein